MHKILFVCYGNICRSPMAQMVMEHIVKLNKDKNFMIDSCATSTEEIGNSMYYMTQKTLEKNNIEILSHYARQITDVDYQKFDYIICFDNNNLKSLKEKFARDKDNKVHLLLEYTKDTKEIIDPWYYRNFDECFTNIYKGCESLYNYIITERK